MYLHKVISTSVITPTMSC